jgi:hypothetical protein
VLELTKQEHLLQQCIVEAIPKIRYLKDNLFLLERIRLVQELFAVPENAQFLRDLIKIKQRYTQKEDDPFILNVVKNQFLMMSHLTVHGAAMQKIRVALV